MQIQPRFDLTCPANAKPVSTLLLLALMFNLSPIFLLVVYNLSFLWYLVLSILPKQQLQVFPCSCDYSSMMPVADQCHWHAWTNGGPKSSIDSSSSSSSSTQTSTSTTELSIACNKPKLISMLQGLVFTWF
jgi:hypothetical protein